MLCPVCGGEFSDEFCTNCGFGKSQNKSAAEWFNSSYVGETEQEAAERRSKIQQLEVKAEPSGYPVPNGNQKESVEDLLKANNALLRSIKHMLIFFTVVAAVWLVIGALSLLFYLIFILPGMYGTF